MTFKFFAFCVHQLRTSYLMHAFAFTPLQVWNDILSASTIQGGSVAVESVTQLSLFSACHIADIVGLVSSCFTKDSYRLCVRISLSFLIH